MEIWYFEVDQLFDNAQCAMCSVPFRTDVAHILVEQTKCDELK